MSYQDEEGLAGQHGLRETHGGGDLDSAQSERPDGGDDVDFISDDGRRAAIGRYTNHWTCSEAALARAAKVDPADLSKWKKGRLPAESDKRARIEKALAKNEKPVPLAKRSREDS
jgi:hypothetical protein